MYGLYRELQGSTLGSDPEPLDLGQTEQAARPSLTRNLRVPVNFSTKLNDMDPVEGL